MTVSGNDDADRRTEEGARRDRGTEDSAPHRPTTRTARFAWGAVTVILIGVAALLVYTLTRGTTTEDVSRPPVTSSGVLSDLSSVPTSVDDAVGAGTSATPLVAPVVLSGQPLLESAGKPEVLFVGAEYCPFCAAESWPLILALSRFGKFRVLHNVQSAPNDAFSGIQSFTFARSSYSSDYVTFTGLELYTNTVDADGAYTKVASLTGGEAALVARYGPRSGALGSPAIPFVDIGNRMVTATSGFSPGVLQGASQSAIVSALDDPGQAIAQAVVGSANELTAGICEATGQQPAEVCTSRGVRAADAAVGLS